MPGIFGLLNPRQSADIPEYLAATAGRLSHRPWHQAETWASPTAPLGIGRVHIGLFNSAPQPLAGPDGCLAWLCGELVREGASELDDLAYALGQYRAHGLDFARGLRGAFFLVIYDPAEARLVLANDRYGLYPHYYHLQGGQLVFAPEVKGVICAPGVEKKPDLTAACEYFRFQQVLGEKTFHEGVSRFPYGSTAVFNLSSGAWQVQRYWDWDAVPRRDAISFEEAVEAVGDALQNAIRRQSAGLRPGVFLSGGLDSRTILGFIPPERHPVTASFGDRNSRDVYYAGQIARAAGSQHHVFDLPDGNWVREYVDLHLELTEGFASWVHMHGISMLDGLRSLMDVNLSGWDGGTVMGHPDHINPVYNHPVDETTVMLHTYHHFHRSYTWPGLTDAEERLLYTPEFGREGIGRAFESLQNEFARFWPMRPEYAAEYFYVTNHSWRLTQNMITTQRLALEARFPFWDYDLVDWQYSLPPQHRRDQLLYRTIITRRLPRLARIPDDKQEYLPSTNPALYTLQKTGVRVLKRLRLFPQRPTLYADYENYLRHELRGWAEEILFDPRTAQRGIYNLSFVRSLLERHYAGHEAWVLGKIAPLITYELMMRAYFDR